MKLNLRASSPCQLDAFILLRCAALSTASSLVKLRPVCPHVRSSCDVHLKQEGSLRSKSAEGPPLLRKALVGSRQLRQAIGVAEIRFTGARG